MRKFNVMDMDRECAVVIVGGKIYEDFNHQFALAQMYEELGITDDVFESTEPLYIEEKIVELSEYTYKMSNKNIIGCYSVFEDDEKSYFIGHTRENIMSNLDIIKDYAKEHNCEIGWFEDWVSEDVILLDL